MKKATDKIYLATTEEIQSLDSSFVGIAHSDPEDIIEPIEYVRTDAFIEKACDFFEENIEEEDCKIGSSEWTELRAEYKSLDSFIRAFVKYIKRE